MNSVRWVVPIPFLMVCTLLGLHTLEGGSRIVDPAPVEGSICDGADHSTGRPSTGPSRCLAIQPFGEVPAEQIEAVSAALIDLYGFEVRLLAPVEHPAEAWYSPRRRWRAERLLEYLSRIRPSDCQPILGMTTADISTTKGEHRDWGILGLAYMPGPAAVISYHRCQRRVREVSPVERLSRVAIHEVGHTLGLPHCPTYGCFMEDAGGTVDTIDRETFLCDLCRGRLVF